MVGASTTGTSPTNSTAPINSGTKSAKDDDGEVFYSVEMGVE